MNDFLNRMILDNSIREYAITIAMILASLVASRFLSRYIAQLLCRLFQRTWKTFDQQTFVDLVLYPLSIFLTIIVTLIALYRLRFPQRLNITVYKYTTAQILQTIGTITVIICFIWLLLRIIDFIARILEKRAAATFDQNDNQLILFFKDFFKVVIGIIGLLMIRHFAFNYNIGTLLTGLSIVGAAIALALRESLENLIASFIIFFDKPFTTGDQVRVQNITGNVERIGLRSTRLRTSDKSYVTVPNKQMVDSILDNVSRRSQIRGEVLLHLNLQTTPDKIQQLIGELKSYLSGIDEVQSSNVLFNDIRIQAYVVLVEFFTLPIEWRRFTAIKQGLNLHTLQTLEKLHIKIAAQNQDGMSN